MPAAVPEGRVDWPLPKGLVRAGFLALVALFPPGSPEAFDLEIMAGPSIASVSPAEESYGERFGTEGTSLGGVLDLRSGGRLGFGVFLEVFGKQRSAGSWEGEVDALLLGALPRFRQSLPLGLELFAGCGAVYVSGDYSGLDEFGTLVEASGSSVGLVVAGGVELGLSGPVACRLEYRRAFADLKTDRAFFDGDELPVYPAYETDLGYDQIGFSLLVSVYGSDRAIVGR